jgi:hypothetical protein
VARQNAAHRNLKQGHTDMVANFAAGALVVIGILIAVLGLFAGGSIVIAGVGLASIVLGGLLSILAARTQHA